MANIIVKPCTDKAKESSEKIEKILRMKRATEELISAAENYLEALCSYNEGVLEVQSRYEKYRDVVE